MSTIDPTVRERLARAGERLLERFGHDDNVTGVGVGFRRCGGKLTDEPVVTVMVKKKRRPSLVSRLRLIPTAVDVDGVSCPTDVVQAQAVLMSADGTPPRVPDMYRPLQFGVGISNFSDAAPDAGTLGAFVRDNTDGTVNMLTANHVIADNNGAPIGDPIYQPASLDDSSNYRVGTLKRYVSIVGGATAVDAAIASIDSRVRVNSNYSGAELSAPSANRPAVGMVVAGDGFGNVWLTRLSTTLTALNVSLLPDTGGTNLMTTVPPIGTKVEKVGRTTGKTVGRVLGTGQTMQVNVPGQGLVRYTDLIWTQWLGWNGDSGAMVIKRDSAGQDDALDGDELDSRDYISSLIRGKFDPCEVLTAMQLAYDVPITRDQALSDNVRDRFMTQSETGRFLITLTYLNTTLVRTRLAPTQTPQSRAYMQSLYNTYQPVITDVMTNPSSTRAITQQDGQTYQALCTQLGQTGVLTATESRIAYDLAQTHQVMLGMNRAAVIDYMNTAVCLNSIRTAAQGMTSLRLWGTARTFDAVE
ncbi:hypothetical protein Q5424_25250 [Conexibacter sp. JD483]|uniref:hypothetical protein n=1 Tax=unclassified Conexibacter TaxID=2627773 RepID=UPI00271859BD|nr:MULTISPECIES: hypothetical protein [unclassified Conexibacter]MDO8187553.1 hypothetical protein [Conexibacter sp. CPCC 205706]MDO8198919.1 hypothetical protein [Conexibacter sp. CPCC 205762]MDR9372429.1 hypothetical protein [Conexibacter sp. JD483]